MEKRLLIVGGWMMRLSGAPDDPSWRRAFAMGHSYWRLADTGQAKGYSIRLRECIQDWAGRPQENRYPCTLNDLLWATDIVVYSYGCATVWHEWHQAQPPIIGTPYESLSIVAGVPDLALGQFKIGLWHAPRMVKKVRCFNVADLAISCDLKETPTVRIGECYDQTVHAMNIDCNPLFSPVMFPGQKHEQIKDHPQVLSAIADLL